MAPTECEGQFSRGGGGGSGVIQFPKKNMLKIYQKRQPWKKRIKKKELGYILGHGSLEDVLSAIIQKKTPIRS